MAEIPFGSPGVASLETETLAGLVTPFAGDTPPPVTVHATVPAESDLKLYQAVEVDASGEIVPAVEGVNAPTAIMAAPAVTAAGETTTAPVYIAGNFRPDALVWDASYDTMAKKLAAFEGAAAPTNIVIREAVYKPDLT